MFLPHTILCMAPLPHIHSPLFLSSLLSPLGTGLPKSQSMEEIPTICSFTHQACTGTYFKIHYRLRLHSTILRDDIIYILFENTALQLSYHFLKIDFRESKGGKERESNIDLLFHLFINSLVVYFLPSFLLSFF